MDSSETLPTLSILVAARNEEQNIAACLEALLQQDYPEGQWEIWVANDGSEDRTLGIIKGFEGKYAHLHCLDIKENLGKARGKANALAHLARKAKGDYLLVTDADTIAPPHWAREMAKHVKGDIGIVTGFTMIEGNGLLAKFQAIDWLYAQYLIQFVSDLGLPVTAMGNNMLVTREAYESVGGYENIPFSITEDYELFKQLTQKGWGFKNVMEEKVMISTKPINGFFNLMQQRKRWMYGAMQLPLYILGILFLQTLFFPIILLMLWFAPVFAFIIWPIKVIVQSIVIGYWLNYFKGPHLLKYLIGYELYLLFSSFSMIIFYLLPVKVTWKGREYKV